MIRSLVRQRRIRRSLSLTLTLIFTVAFLPAPPAAQRATGSAASAQEPQIPTIAPGSAYRQTNLVTDSPGLAPVLDPLLVNPWGISLTATSPFWVANTGTSTSTLYRGDVGGAPLAPNPGLRSITIPPTPPPPPGSLPTGTVANTVNTDFVLPGPCASAPCGANFLFATITGKIMGWDPNAPAAGSATAVEAASQPGHVYTGLAIGNNGSGNFLYAADFQNNNIDVFNSSFALQPEASFPFVDPTLPAGYHAHNIQALGGELYVAYARPNPTPAFPGDFYLRPGGAVSVFDFNGAFKRRIHLSDPSAPPANDPLSAPWGLAIAPGSFGIFSNALLVGNFTFEDNNGRISAFNPTTGAFLGQLQNEAGQPISIDGLWGLQFGNGVAGGDVNTLYFAAGIGHEQHGLFGKLNPTTSTATSLIQFATGSFAMDEAGGHVDFTVIRTGNTSGTATVNYNTFDEPGAGNASQKSDYQIALGTLTFAPGETSKTFRILLVNDTLVEGDEVIELRLSNPTGAGVGLGSPNEAEVLILDNDTAAPTSNPIDDSTFFVRQHYLDFLNREPDAPGLAFWVNEIEKCGSDAQCREVRRINVSAAFFLSIEFQRTGYLAYLTHRAAFGPTAPGSPAPVLYGNFMRDVQALQRGFVFGQPGAEAVLEANKVAYFNDFVTRPEFVVRYPSTMTNTEFVNALLASADFEPADVRLFVVQMTNGQENPPAVPTTTTGAPRPASFGTARFQFNEAQTALSFTATVTNIDVTGSQTADTNDNLTAAHIHASATASPETNAGVVFGFFGTPFNDNNPNDLVFFPTGTVGGTFRSKWDAPEGNNTTLAAQLDNLRSGRAYINFHTRQFPGGEVRGNFPAATAFRDQLIARMNAGATRAEILRAVAEAEELNSREFNRAFVTMEYFGYLRRDPDTPGFNFWLDKLNAFGGNFQNAEMVKAFLSSSEYRQRFGPS
jgi:uncharacterized protein (TIGR03118 family)